MGLADPERPEDEDVIAVLDEVAAGEHLHLLPVDRGLVAEVEGLQGFHEREAGHRGAHGDVLARLGRDLLGQDLLERSEEHTSELQSFRHLVCRLLLEKKKNYDKVQHNYTNSMTRFFNTEQGTMIRQQIITTPPTTNKNIQ